MPLQGNPYRSAPGGAWVGRFPVPYGHGVAVGPEPGRGSCFSIKVPMANRELSTLQAEKGAAVDRPFEGLRVLLLDRDMTTANSVRLLVEDWGGSVQLMPSAEDAADLLGKAGALPHAVLADLRFGGASGGIVAMRQLLARSEQPIRGIILVEENTPVREREIALAGYRMVAKPIAPDELFHALQ